MNEINLRVTLDEANILLEALGNLPFVKVYLLIGKVQEQANQQLSSQMARPELNGTVALAAGALAAGNSAGKFEE